MAPTAAGLWPLSQAQFQALAFISMVLSLYCLLFAFTRSAPLRWSFGSIACLFCGLGFLLAAMTSLEGAPNEKPTQRHAAHLEMKIDP